MRRFVLVFLLGMLLAAPHAAAGPPLPQGPTFTFHPSTSGATVHRTHVLWSNGSATGSIVAAKASRRLVFEVRTDPCEGPARLEVRVDGQHLMTRDIAGRGIYAVPGDWAAGAHHVSFRFTNDLVTDRCDRNLKVEYIRFDEPYLFDDQVGYPVAQYADLGTAAVSPVTAGRTMPADPWTSTIGAMLYADGTATVRLDSQGATRLHVDLKTFACGGEGAAVRIAVDGVVRYDGKPSQWSYYPEYHTVPIDGPFENGTHDIAVSFTNDHREGGGYPCDRNVMVQGVRFSGSV